MRLRNVEFKTKVAVVGLGKLGLPMAIAMAERGASVVGIECDPKRLRLICNPNTVFEEPRVGEGLKKFLKNRRLTLTNDYEAILKTEACFVAVNTPERGLGEMDVRGLEACIAAVGKTLRESSEFYVIAIASTLVPETTDGRLRRILETTSKRKVGRSVGIAAHPVFIALGTVIRDYLNPPVVVIGATDRKTSQWMTQFYRKICQNHPPFLVTHPHTAEVIKLAHNAYCTSKMAFINELGDLCRKVPTVDLHKVEEFFRLGGERIGQFLRAGLGFGGPCFPRDLRFFIKYIEEKGLKSPLLKAIHPSNQEHARELVKQIRNRAGRLEGKKVAVLGLSYKPGVRNFDDSFSFQLIRELIKGKAQVSAYDSLLNRFSRNSLPPLKGFTLKKNLQGAVNGTDVCILALPSPEFRNLKENISSKTRPFVFDPWGVLAD